MGWMTQEGDEQSPDHAVAQGCSMARSDTWGHSIARSGACDWAGMLDHILD